MLKTQKSLKIKWLRKQKTLKSAFLFQSLKTEKICVDFILNFKDRIVKIITIMFDIFESIDTKWNLKSKRVFDRIK